MESIPDATPLSTISIPGSHESLTLYGGIFVRCQSWTLDKQLQVGLRYFDVHAGIWFPGKEVGIWNSAMVFWQHIQFSEVLKIILEFLTQNKSETVLLKVTLHGFYQKQATEKIMKLIEQFRDRIWTELEVPNMQQARGKIVFLQSDTLSTGTKNYNSFFLENNQFIKMKEKLKEAQTELCGRKIILTDVTTYFKNPKTVAKTFNQQLNNIIVENQMSLNPRCLGVLSLTYPSPDLIEKIIEINPCICSKGGEYAEIASEPATTPQPAVAEPSTTSGPSTEPTSEHSSESPEPQTPSFPESATQSPAPEQVSETSVEPPNTSEPESPTPEHEYESPEQQTTTEEPGTESATSEQVAEPSAEPPNTSEPESPTPEQDSESSEQQNTTEEPSTDKLQNRQQNHQIHLNQNHRHQNKTLNHLNH
ncbi:1-phosphatidylinositol phosphodiesterase-like [Genypterus blacodes]|uniref:1-phosphatidylinositol phosphodiesterase-like n=1 Tax=Genypterus blacodes TaxID=154954 RepID=UPI003F7689FC